jgi:muramoyltetrapeptide carboxypeptidase
VLGLVSPGGVLDDAGIQRRVVNLEVLGFKVRLGDHIRAAYGGYAGTPMQRAADLHRMFADREVRALWAARGGSGCLQLLPLLDYELARRHPKILVGFSDLTALHLALHHRAGLVTFHGPTAGSTFSDYSVGNLRAVLMEGAMPTFQLSAEQLKRAQKEAAFRPRTINRGIAEGPLWGGNLSMVCAMMGTPYLAGAGGALVFLEEVGEAPYRVDRMLTQLRHAGTLRRARGLLLGVFARCEPPDDEPSVTLAEAVDDNVGAVPHPAVYGYSFGHVAHQYTLPVGVRARLDTEARTVALLERAVV